MKFKMYKTQCCKRFQAKKCFWSVFRARKSTILHLEMANSLGSQNLVWSRVMMSQVVLLQSGSTVNISKMAEEVQKKK